MATRDALLHFAHFLCIFALVSLVTGELVLLRRSLPRDLARRMQLIDRWYGISAGLVILTGLGLMTFGAKGAAYYIHNPIFWTKMGLFAVVALLSISPTVTYLRWREVTGTDGTIALEDREFTRIRGLLWAQLGVIVLLPLCAALMANGI